MSSSKQSFKFVLVPENPKDPIQELVCEYNSSTIVQCLTDQCKVHYKKNAVVSSKKQQAAYREGVVKQILEKNPNFNVVEQAAVLDQFMGMQMVAVEPILLAKKENNWYGVSMYCDDSAGQKENVQINQRASHIMNLCGRPMEVLGDAFFSASIDDQRDLFKRLDLTLSDFSPEAKWVKMAMGQAIAKAQSAVAKKVGVTPAMAASYRKKLDEWVKGKLKGFDEDESVRKVKLEKYGSREGDQKFLAKKADAKYKATVN